MDRNVVTALMWVRRGFAKAQPKEYELDEAEIEKLKLDPQIKKNLKRDMKDIDEEEGDGDTDQNNKREGKNNNEEDDDDDDDDDEDGPLPVFAAETEYLREAEENLNKEYPFGIDNISEEEKDDFTIKATDSILVAAKLEKEFSSLEIYIYEEDKSNLYVHHEIQLSAFPLALQWLSVEPSSFDAEISRPGNYAIVGTFLPEIEIWDLDMLNVIEPSIVLGGELQQQQQSGNNKRVKNFKKKRQFKEGSHTDAVISLSLNGFRKNILCSGSADTSVKIWDIGTQKNIHTYQHHQDKVQVVSWSPKEDAILVSGAYDKRLVLFDARAPQNSLSCKLNSAVEAAIWDPLQHSNLIFSTEDGSVAALDARKFSMQNALFNFKAHNKETTSLSLSTKVPGMLCTTSTDNSVKLWDLNTIAESKPRLITQKFPNAGNLFCGQFCEDNPWVFACGNSKGEIFVWDTAEDKRVVQAFAPLVEDEKLRPRLEDCTQGEIKVQQHQSDDDDDDEDDDEDDQYNQTLSNRNEMEQENSQISQKKKQAIKKRRSSQRQEEEAIEQEDQD